MVREPSVDRAERMLLRIREDLDANPEAGPWLEAARTLYERLLISEDTWYYLAELLTECLVFAGSSADPELVRIHEQISAIERAHGLDEDESFDIDDAPAEWTSLNAEWDHRADEIVNTYLRENGHADVAALRAADPNGFEGRLSKGRTDLWGEDDDDS